MAAALGLAYAMEGRIATGLALVEQGVEQTAARGTARSLAPRGHLRSARRICWPVAWKRHASALSRLIDLARQYQQRGYQAWALWLLGESTARQASPEGEPAVSHYRQALALAEELGMRPSRRTATRASACCTPGKGSRSRPVCSTNHCHQVVPYYGNDTVATPGRNELGAGGMICHMRLSHGMLALPRASSLAPLAVGDQGVRKRSKGDERNDRQRG